MDCRRCIEGTEETALLLRQLISIPNITRQQNIAASVSFLTCQSCCYLRVESVQLDDAVSDECVSLSRLSVEVSHIAGEGTDEGSRSIRVADDEVCI